MAKLNPLLLSFLNSDYLFLPFLNSDYLFVSDIYTNLIAFDFYPRKVLQLYKFTSLYTTTSSNEIP